MTEIMLPANGESISLAQDFAIDMLEEKAISSKTDYQIRIVVDEIVSNIVNYSGIPENPGFEMSVDLLDDPPRVRMQFRDRGTQFNPLALETPDRSPEALLEREGGLGIFMVKQMTDESYYAYKDGYNVLTLVKSLC